MTPTTSTWAQDNADLAARADPASNDAVDECVRAERFGLRPADPSEPAPWPSLDSAALHGLAGEVVATIEPQSESDPAALLVTFLVGFGAAVGSAPRARADGADHPARLFAVIVGDSAKARKGSSLANVRPVWVAGDRFFRDGIRSGFGSGEALIEKVSGDNDRRLLVVEPEYARLLNVARRDGSTLSPHIRAAWDGGRLEVNVRAHGASVSVEGAHIAVIGHITASELRAKLTETEIASGFLNRHLLVCARRSKLLPSGGNIDERELNQLGTRMKDILAAARRVQIMRRTKDAEELWEILYRFMADDDPGGLLGAVVARDAAQVLRLSVTYALLDQSKDIDVAHVEAAWALWRYCRASAEYLFGDALGDEVADRLLAALRAAGAGGLSRDEQYKALGGHTSAKRLEVARQMLIERSYAVEEEEKTDGRPRVVLRDARKAREARKGVSSHNSLSSHRPGPGR